MLRVTSNRLPNMVKPFRRRNPTGLVAPPMGRMTLGTQSVLTSRNLQRQQVRYVSDMDWARKADWIRGNKLLLQKQHLLFKAKMIRKKRFALKLPFVDTWGKRVFSMSFSDLAGHGSFVVLMLMYMESDILALRAFAMSGISLSIFFQYYREKPLWLPIKWNILFLLINAVMMAQLLKDNYDVQNIPAQDMMLFEDVFKAKGMTPVDFLHLIDVAKKRQFKKGEKMMSQDLKNIRVQLVIKGKASQYKNGFLVRPLEPYDFVGAMSYLSWDGKKAAQFKSKQVVWKAYDHWNVNPGEIDGFAPLFMGFESEHMMGQDGNIGVIDEDHSSPVLQAIGAMYKLLTSQDATQEKLSTGNSGSNSSNSSNSSSISMNGGGADDISGTRGTAGMIPSIQATSINAAINPFANSIISSASSTTSTTGHIISNHHSSSSSSSSSDGDDGRPMAVSTSDETDRINTERKEAKKSNVLNESDNSSASSSRWSSKSSAMLVQSWHSIKNAYNRQYEASQRERRKKERQQKCAAQHNDPTGNCCHADDDIDYDDEFDLEHDHQSSSSSSGGEGVVEGQADVICLEDCIVYSWSFDQLQEVSVMYPSLAMSFERCLSDDITRKMTQSLNEEHLQRYQQILTGAIMDGETTERSKAMLAEFRRKHNIDDHFHSQILAMAGWTDHDFKAGYKGAPSAEILDNYLQLLKEALNAEPAEEGAPVITEKARAQLRQYRMTHGIRGEAHLEALHTLGWSIDDFEVGSRISPFIPV